MPKLVTLSIDLLRLDGGTQARVATNGDAVDDYAAVIEDFKGEWPFGPVDVFHDGSDYFVADGFHRTLAAIRMKRASVPCRIHNGTAKDAKIFGMTANDHNGLRMTRADKRACVEWLLDNGGKMTQTKIAETAGVTDRTVRAIVSERRDAESSDSSQTTEQNTPTGGQNRKVSGSSGVTTEDSEPQEGNQTSESSGEQDSASIVLDAIGRAVPEKYRAANEAGISLLSIGREMDQYRQRAKKIAEAPGGEWINMADVDSSVRTLKRLLQHARYYTECPMCDGTRSSCGKCKGVGWIPESLKGTINT